MEIINAEYCNTGGNCYCMEHDYGYNHRAMAERDYALYVENL